MIRFRDYLWDRLQRPLWTSWLVLVTLSVVGYSVVVVFLKDKQLKSSLSIAAYTVDQSIQAGDWSLALGHLRSLEKLGPAFDITLRDKQDTKNISGPFGEEPIGIGTICGQDIATGQWVLRGCMRVFGATELYTLGFFVVFAVLVFGISFRQFRSKSLFFIGKISDELDEMQRESDAERARDDQPITEISAIRQHIQSLREQTVLASRSKAFTELSVQVAHDIRSPLAALDMVVKDAAVLPESERILVRGAVSRITDIANNLITQYSLAPSAGQIAPQGEPDTATHLIPSMVQSIVSEKRMQFRSRLGVEICATADVQSYGLFAKVGASEFKRLLSNLINNSVEAISESGRVDVAVKGLNGSLELSVTDSGKGIPADVLPRLMQKGASFDKTGGTGFGLFHAKETVEAWGGEIVISSKEGEGTSVKAILPKAAPPPWFVSEVLVSPEETIAILDDDPSIHHIWQRRFDEVKAAHKPLPRIMHFSTVEEFKTWIGTQQSRRSLCLMDFELIGQKENGLEVIEALGISGRSILVTSRYEEPSVLQRCRALGIRIIPKPMAPVIPIAVVPVQHQRVDCVLIDDDPQVHLMWEIAAKKRAKRLLTFGTVESFFEAARNLSADTIYIDSDLGEGVRGEAIAKSIRALGFARVFLTTGYGQESFVDLPWLSGVVGKQPPWTNETAAGSQAISEMQL